MKHGTLKADAVVIGEIEVNLLAPTAKVHAKAAFVSTTTGQTHAWTTHTNWSPDTMRKLAELREAMEEDIAAEHFEGGGQDRPRTAREEGGLGEHLRREQDGEDEDADPV